MVRTIRTAVASLAALGVCAACGSLLNSPDRALPDAERQPQSPVLSPVSLAGPIAPPTVNPVPTLPNWDSSEPAAERLARIEHVLLYEYYADHHLSTEDHIWYAKYWESHQPEDLPASEFPVAGESLIRSVGLFGVDTLEIEFNLPAGSKGMYFSLRPDPEIIWGSAWRDVQPTLKSRGASARTKFRFRLIGPQRSSLPITVAAKTDLEQGTWEELTVRVPLPRLDMNVQYQRPNLHVALDGDLPTYYEGMGWEYRPVTTLSALPAYGALARRTDNGDPYSLPNEVDFEFEFVPRAGHDPLAIVVASSNYWRYRSQLVELGELAVNSWRYDYAGGVLHVDADPDAELSLSLPDDVQLTADAAGSWDFAVEKADSSYGATLIADDGSYREEYKLRLGSPAAALPLDTLRAWPLQREVRVGEPVRIVVASGQTLEPFSYMTGVRITAPQGSGFEYVRNSFDVGAPGGNTGQADGGWEVMDPYGFLLAPDAFYWSELMNGQIAWDFNVTPLEGAELFFSGELFNFEAVFTQPGTWQLGLVASDEYIDRTYYQDESLARNIFWTDISNRDMEGMPSGTITVLPAE